MATFGLVPFHMIVEMLNACAPGFRVQTREHNFCVQYNNRTYPSLPRGDHGPRKNPDIQVGKIRQMIRQLHIDAACAARYIPLLK